MHNMLFTSCLSTDLGLKFHVVGVVNVLCQTSIVLAFRKARYGYKNSLIRKCVNSLIDSHINTFTHSHVRSFLSY